MRSLAAIAAVCVLAMPGWARAHRGSAKYIAIEPTERGAIAEVELEVVDAAVELGLGEDAPEAEVLAQSARLIALLEAGITLESASGPCEARAGAPRSIEGEDGPARLSVAIEYVCTAPVRARVLRDGTVFPTDAQHEAFVRVRLGTATDARVLRAGRQEIAIDEPPSTAALVLGFGYEGVLHLVTGYDHLLFLLALVLGAGMLARKEGLRVALRDVGAVVTAFTVGHSVTLIAAALGVIVLPSRWVETTIAASIAVVAIMNVRRPEARAGRVPLALGFGLIHGLGFSSVLAELGLPAQARVACLLSFNVGIELAQLAFVAAVLPALQWLAGRPGYRRWVVQGGSGVIAALASLWMIERAFW